MITIDEKGLAEAQKLLADMPKAIPKAAARAINRAAAAAKKAAWDQVKKTYTIKRARVSKAWDKITKATASNPSATLTSRGSVMPSSYFTTKPKNPPKRRPKNPVFVQVRRDGGGPIPGAFVARTGSGHTGVFHRLQEGTRGAILQYMRTGKPRPKKKGVGMTKGKAAIEQNYGPSVPQMLGSKSVSAFIEERASEVLNQRFEHEINAILNGVTK